MNVDPLAPLRKLPVKVRKYYYNIFSKLGALTLVITPFLGGDAQDVGLIVTAILGVASAALSNVHTNPNEPESPDEIVEQEHFLDETEEDGQPAKPKVRVKFKDGRSFEGEWVNDEPV